MAKKTKGYGFNNPLQDIFPNPIIATRAPTTSDKNYPLGMMWVDKSADKTWTLTSVSAGSATWALASPGDSDVDTLTGDTGGAISPTAGDIILAGGTNIATAGSGSTITFNLDDAITLATSVTSPLYTAAAATDVDIEAPSGQDVIIKLGDDAGANKLSVTDDSDVEVFAVDSTGTITFSGLTVTGAFTQTAGVVSISEDNSANAVGIANGTTARAVSIASSAAAHTVAIGSDSGAASLDLKAGTGNFTLDGAATTTYTVGASTTSGTITIGGTSQTGTMTFGSSDGTSTVEIASGAGASTVNIAKGTGGNTVAIAAGAGANIVSLGSASGAGSLTLRAGTGNFSLDGAATTTYTFGPTTTSGTINFGGTGANTGTMTIAGGTGAQTINIANSTGGKTVNLATGAGANLVSIGSDDTSSSLDLKAGTGNFTLDGAATTTYTVGASTTSGTISIGGTSQTGTFTLGGSDGAMTMNIANADGAKTINIGAGVDGNTISVGNGINTSAQTINIAGGAAAEASTVNLHSGNATNGVQTVNIATGTSTGGRAINIATGSATNSVIMGSISAASSLTLRAGTGNITVTGTVEEINAKQLNRTGATITFKSSPTTCTAANTGGAATGTTGATNLLSFAQGIVMEQFIIGAGQTIIKPVMDTSGLLCSLDLVDTEGVEYNFGAARTLSEYAFTIGTDAAFFFEVEMTLADISGGNPYFIGFRKAAANNGTYTSYTDYYALGMNAVTSATNVTLASELNGGGTTLQDSGTAWTGGDGGTVTLRVLVSAAGVVTATIDGGAPVTPLAYTFDSTDVVCPFIHLVHNADAAAIHLVSMSVGYQ